MTLSALAVLLAPSPARAQAHAHAHSPADSTADHAMPAMPGMHHAPTPMRAAHEGMTGMAMDHMHAGHAHAAMSGMYGPYPFTREASGTAWQPDAAEHRGMHVMRGAWTAMVHGYADVVDDDQGGRRGDTKLYSDNMAMVMAWRALGAGRLGLRGMASLEPATIGRHGYPLLLQSGETGDGRTLLVDRQHPHDLFMELAGTYSVSRGTRSIFVYAGLPGEPALGPPAFMHRFSASSLPAAPIAHHWLDSSHITYGVLTAGAVAEGVKLEASAFRGREPDEHRWDLESPKLDSHAFRLSLNPGAHAALQVSYGRLHSPEQLEPEVDQDRTTASAMVDGASHGMRWEGTLAWGRDRNRPGHTLDAVTAEAAAEVRDRHTVFARLERVAKDELVAPPDPRTGRAFDVGEVTAGYRYDFHQRAHASLGIGVAGTLAVIPRALRDLYGTSPTSALVFMRAALR